MKQKDRAIVKKTGAIYDIVHKFMTANITIDITISFDSKPKIDSPDKNNISDMISHYWLSDGNEYLDDELIVGKSSVRNYLIDQMLK